MGLVEILIVIALVIASVLGLYLIKLVKRLFITLDIVEAKVKELDEKVTPLLLELQQMANSGNTVAEFAKEQTEFASEIVGSIKNKFGGLVTKNVAKDSTPQSNAKNLVTNLRAFVKGAVSFISELK